ncbi:MAG: hypothetical protein KAR20_29960, partial [Candidatus Heimdallarchaeota archaeon]|nr:hypothetical protein [Candidatus Heimdallarchaeota archaeon]
MLDTPKKMRSNTPKWTLTFISILAYGIFIVIMFVNVISGDANERVPFTNLPQTLHLILLTMIWPIVGGFLAVVVFPRLLVPLYLRMKKISNKKYTNCVIYLERPINFKSVLKRAFSVFLLVMGLESVFLPMIDITTLYMPTQLLEEGVIEELLLYNPQAFIVTAGLLFPIALMLFALVWTIQDSGLMHYNLSADLTEYQEIEPVY